MRKVLKVGDRVSVYLNVPSDAFTGVIRSVNAAVANDVWYEVTPDGQGVADGRTFWHRETHVKKEREQ